MAKETNKYLGYQLENNILTLEWKLKPNQSYSNFERVAVIKARQTINELFSQGQLQPIFKNVSYNIEIEETYKIVVEPYGV